MADHIKLNLETLLKLKNDYKDDLVIAFLGNPKTGKTIHSALIQDAATNYLRQASNDEYYGFVTEGDDAIYEIIDLLNNGNYPPPTLRSNTTKIKIQINSTKTSDYTNLYLQDMSGEHSRDYLEKEILHGQELKRVEDILNQDTSSENAYGEISHLVIADVYIILINCEEYENWPSRQLKIATMIKNIHNIKKILGDVHLGKFVSPVALIFSKYDTLPKEEKKLAIELFQKFDAVKNVLQAHQDNDDIFKCFISNVNSRKLTAQESRKKNRDLLKENSGMVAINNKINDLTILQNEQSENMDNALADLNSKKQTLKNIPQEQLKKINDVQSAVNDASVIYNNAKFEFNKNRKQLSNAKQQLEYIQNNLKHNPNTNSSYAPIRPLSYNHDDYVELIQWLINLNKKIKG